MKFLLKFQSNLTSWIFLMMNFTLKYSKNNDFHDFFFFFFFFFLTLKNTVSAIFCVFRFVLNFRDFSMFSVSRKICHRPGFFKCFLLITLKIYHHIFTLKESLQCSYLYQEKLS